MSTQNEHVYIYDDLSSLENGELDATYDNAESTLSDKIVRYSYTQYSISSLIEWIDDGIINIPSYQRRFIWKKSQSTMLIDSILRGLPIPPIVLFENPKTNTLELIDGLQRILSMYYFFKNKFPKNPEIYKVNDINSYPDEFEEFYLTPALLGIKRSDIHDTANVSTTWINKNYEALHSVPADNVRSYQHKFKSYIVGVLQINSLIPSYETSLELFSRLNKGGTQLEINEIRMRTASEKTLSEMRIILHDQLWKNLVSAYVPQRKDTSRELLLRIIVMLNRYETQEQIIPMHRMLDDLMKLDGEYIENKKENAPSQLFERYKSHIVTSLEQISDSSISQKPFVFGDSNRLNSSLAETIIVPITFAHIKGEQVTNEKISTLIETLSSEDISYQIYNEKFRSIMGIDSSKIKSILIRHAISSEIILGKNIFKEQLSSYENDE